MALHAMSAGRVWACWLSAAVAVASIISTSAQALGTCAVGTCAAGTCTTGTCAQGTCAPGVGYGCIPATQQRCCWTAGAWPNCVVCPAGSPRPSQLYGCGGELFNASNSRLMDWSFAGYMYGDLALPTLPAMADMKDTFGAVGDGVTDDTAAFDIALTTIEAEGTLYLPPGTYVITRRIDIAKRIFIRGAGPGRTVLLFPRSLSEIYGNNWNNGVSQYAFGPGFINFNGADFPDQNTLIAMVTGNAAKGSRIIPVNDTSNVFVGQTVRIVMDNPNGTLLHDFNSRIYAPFTAWNNRNDVIRWTSKVRRVIASPPSVELERVLPFNVNTAYRPELHDWVSWAHGVKRNTTGVADLTFRFPGNQMWAGENRELGFNGLYFYATAHSWVRNVVFENAELGVAFDSSSFSNMDNITFRSTRPTNATRPFTGSRGLWLKATFDCVIHNFRMETLLAYDILLSAWATNNVISQGVAPNMHIEFMYATPYGNLVTDMDLGNGTDPFGWVVRGQDVSSFNTFWNLRARGRQFPTPPYTWAPMANWIGNQQTMPPGANNVSWYFEPTVPIFPPNLWLAQRTARGRPIPPPIPRRFFGPGFGCLTNGTRCCTTPMAGCITCPTDFRQPSSLWGCGGELWRATERIGYEWSLAGYQQGNTIPLPAVTHNLRTHFGARGDGVTDDTQALVRALNNMTRGVLLIPAGTYIIRSVINWRKPIILRGEGRGRTILRWPQSLTDLYGNTWVEGKWVGTSQYSHGTGLMNIGGWDPSGRDFSFIVNVTRPANKGDRVLNVTTTAGLVLGQWVRLFMADPPDGSLMFELQGRMMGVPGPMRGYADPVRFLARITAMGPTWVRLERPIPVRVDLRWRPSLHRFMPMIDGNVGVEYLTMDFPWSAYPGHFLEQGWNGIHFNQVVNGWVRGVTVTNGDMGVYFWGTAFCTIEDLVLAATPRVRAWQNGHRGIWLEHGSDNMLRNVNISVRYVHDISVSGTEHGTVVHNTVGFDLNFDHHRSCPYANLWTNVDVGKGTRVFESSGDVTWGPHSCMHSTFHNVMADLRYLLPRDDFGPNCTFIGLPTDDSSDPDVGWFVELMSRPWPSNLYDAFRSTRAARMPA